ncbi:hypothetical protein M436DRAFT_62088 [Aureobasidium namibiae CBS 147.97]|uniref:Zn(2)-C6 fungal-type domain-containing protein n=1 Tax=Aureobasidium namibiae CBS 147.97 TaxID=1043004 RepID=A0A074XMA5_9PEZI|nr:uncharacterized protein M436DRAFT_62088 [Aureobasidium namibiae CBS 147.97]KEQ75706.1 hypothetical protein M436DRAFT_62088 [Aureobasidium namibiae CBS 147.97]
MSDGKANAKGKQKRVQIPVACVCCRQRKKKARFNRKFCDGKRPTCSACSISQQSCTYTAEPDAPPIIALKRKHDALQRQYADVTQLLSHFKSASQFEAHKLLELLRQTDTDMDTMLEFARALPPSDPDISGRPTAALETFDHSREHGNHLVKPSLTTHRSESISEPRSSISMSTWQEPRNFVGSFEGLTNRHEIPCENKFRTAISCFHHGAGKLFGIFSQDQIESSFDQVFRVSGGRQSSAHALCRLSCLAAVGCLYTTNKEHSELPKDDFYRIASVLFEYCLDAGSLASATFCTLMALFHALSRMTAALGYIELGISFCRKHDIQSDRRPQEISSELWLSSRRAWRCMMFLGAWISSTIGYISGNVWDALDKSNATIHDHSIGSDMEDSVQIQMVKIAVVQRNILDLSLASSSNILYDTHEIRLQLLKWYREMPPFMQLSTMVDQAATDLDSKSRYSIYLCHCLYLGTLMMFHRRIVLALGRFDPDQVPVLKRALQLEGLAHDSVVAAHQTASILGLLLDQGAIFERCWIVLLVFHCRFDWSALTTYLSFQAHASATTLMYDLACRKADGASLPYMHEKTLERIRICIRVVTFCATVDPVARVFERTLQPCYVRFSDHEHDPTSEPDVGWKNMKDQLYYQMLMPYERVADYATTGSLTHDCNSCSPIQSLTTSRVRRLWLSNSLREASRTSRISHFELDDDALPSFHVQPELPPNDLRSPQEEPTSLDTFRSGLQSSRVPVLASLLEELRPGHILREFLYCGWS